MEKTLAELVLEGDVRRVWIRLPVMWPASRFARWGAKRSSLSLNKLLRTNWRQRSHIGKTIRDYISIALSKEGIRVRPLIREATLRVTFFHGKRRIRDGDTFLPKPLVDGLVGHVIEDDRETLLRIVPVEFAVDARDPRIEIEISETTATGG